MNMHKVGRLLNNIRTEWEKVRQPGSKVIEVKNASTRPQMYLYDMIGGFDGITATMVVNTLAQLEGDLDLHINSRGGDIFEGVAIHNAFKNYAGNIEVYIDSMAASAASFVAMAGDKIIIEKNAQMMIHEARATVFDATIEEIDEVKDLMETLNDVIAEMYADRAKADKDHIRALMKAETYFTATEAVEIGLADEINGVPATTNAFDLSLFNYTTTTVTNTATDQEGPHDHPPAVDVDGLRDALKGAFA